MAHLQLEARIGGSEAAAQAHDVVEHAYDAAAALLGRQRDEIAMVENATRTWDMAFYAVPLGPGDRVIMAMAEYASNYIAFLQVVRKTAAVVEVIPNDASGQLSVEALRRAINDRVKLIAITHVPTNSARSLAPRRWDRWHVRQRFENWETYYAGKIGLGVAIDYALRRIGAIWARIKCWADDLRQRLCTMADVTVRDEGGERCGSVSFTVAESDADEVQRLLAKRRIHVSVSPLSSTRLDMEARGLPDPVRASVHSYNTEEEIARFCTELAMR